ncbi:29008_t:CDS:2, partial [Gigaspora margarita]
MLDWVLDFQTRLKLLDQTQAGLEPSQKFDIQIRTELNLDLPKVWPQFRSVGALVGAVIGVIVIEVVAIGIIVGVVVKACRFRVI